MTSQKVNNNTTKDLRDSDADKTPISELKRMMNEMKKEIHKLLNEIKENMNKQLNEFKEDQRDI
jgi:DNA anti-recombination protein RmuC